MSFVESEEESEFECSMLGVVSVMQRRLEEESERESRVVRWWNSDLFEVAGDFTIGWFVNYVNCTSEYSSQISLMELGLCETTTAEYLENRLRRAGITLDSIYSLNDSSVDEARSIGCVRSEVQCRVAILEAKLSNRRYWEETCREELERLVKARVFKVASDDSGDGSEATLR